MMFKLKDILLEGKSNLTVYHGTNIKHLSAVKSKGLISKDYNSAQWYMVATDFGSALFHAMPQKENESVLVVEFKVLLTNERWDGYPFFWPPYIRSGKSKWYALKQPLLKKFIKKIHQVSHDDWLKQKEIGL